MRAAASCAISRAASDLCYRHFVQFKALRRKKMPSMTRVMRCGLVAFMGIGLGASVTVATAEEPTKAELDAVRQALSKYEDVYTAVREGYFSTVGCVHYSGEKMEGHMDYPKGAMGVHFVNLGVAGPPDPMRPNVLVYEPDEKGLHLV